MSRVVCEMAPLAMGLKVLQRLHVVQAVAEFDQDHAHVARQWRGSFCAGCWPGFPGRVEKFSEEILVTPSTSSATVLENCAASFSTVTPQSSTTSCSRPAAIVAGSLINPARSHATREQCKK